MNNDLLVHPKTRRQVTYFQRRPPQQLLIIGRPGSGSSQLAIALAADFLGVKSVSDLMGQPFFLHVKRTSESQEISIESVRNIIKFLKLKTPGKRRIRRVVLVEEAQHMSDEAQNALLKILEEPNQDTVFILTAPHKLSLLPTIVSRCQRLQCYPVTLQQAAEHYGLSVSEKQLDSAWRLSQGNGRLLQELLEHGGDYPLKKSIQTVKDFLGLDRYERLLFLDRLAKNKDDTRLFLEALAIVLAALHKTSIDKSNLKQASKFLKSRLLVNKLLDALEDNSSTKLVTLKMLLNLEV